MLLRRVVLVPRRAFATSIDKYVQTLASREDKRIDAKALLQHLGKVAELMGTDEWKATQGTTKRYLQRLCWTQARAAYRMSPPDFAESTAALFAVMKGLKKTLDSPSVTESMLDYIEVPMQRISLGTHIR